MSAVDKDMLDDLTGDNSSNPYSILNVNIRNRESFIAYSKAKGHSELLERTYQRNFIVSFWKGDYVGAEKIASILETMPHSKNSKVQLIYYMFYKGIVLFNFYREGKGDNYLDQGKEILDQVEIWANDCNESIFKNKLILLEAGKLLH